MPFVIVCIKTLRLKKKGNAILEVHHADGTTTEDCVIDIVEKVISLSAHDFQLLSLLPA